MIIEGASTQSLAYSSPKPESIQRPKQAEPIDNQIKNSVEILSHTKLTLGYQPTVQEKLIMESIETANRKILGPEREFEFAIHKQTKQIMVKVIDKNTQEVLREIPAEKVLDAVAHMCEVAGIFMDEKR